MITKTNFISRNLGVKPLAFLVLAFILGSLASSNIRNATNHAVSYLLERVPYLDEVSSARLIKQYDEMNWSEPNEKIFADISAAMSKSPSLRNHILRVYLGEPFLSPKRYGSQNLLSENFDPSTVELAKSLIKKESSPLDKVNGISLIVYSGGDATPFQDQFREILLSESDNGVLVTVTLALTRPTSPAPDVRQRIVNRLHELTFSPSNILRGVAVKKLAEWDGDGQLLRADILRLLSEQDKDDRMNAIVASTIGPAAHHISIKDRLLQVLADVNEDPEVRGTAWDALYKYDLNENEYAIYKEFN